MSFPQVKVPPLKKCSETKGPGEKGAPEIIQKFRLRNWPVSGVDFPMTPMEGQTILALFLGEKDSGAISGGPCSPALFTAD